MDSYNFWSDLLDTYQSMPDFIKALWILVPPGFVLALIAMLRTRPLYIDGLPDEPVYLLYRTKAGMLVALPELGGAETLEQSEREEPTEIEADDN